MYEIRFSYQRSGPLSVRAWVPLTVCSSLPVCLSVCLPACLPACLCMSLWLCLCLCPVLPLLSSLRRLMRPEDELGHNLGCSHNRDEYDDEEDQHDYAHGFRYCTGDDPYRTIMSYGCPRASAFSATVYKGNHYSNPDVYYQGKPTGTDTENCARAISENKVRPRKASLSHTLRGGTVHARRTLSRLQVIRLGSCITRYAWQGCTPGSATQYPDTCHSSPNPPSICS